MWMSAKPSPTVPGIDFLVDARGRRKSVVIDLRRHRALWEDIYDAYLAGKRRNATGIGCQSKEADRVAAEAAHSWPRIGLASLGRRARISSA